MLRYDKHLLLLLTVYVVLFQQDEYSRLSRNASLGVHGYALVFSIASKKSFDIIDQVNDSLLNTLGDAPDVPRVLVGSMNDLSDQRQVRREVSVVVLYPLRMFVIRSDPFLPFFFQDAQKLADSWGVPYIECSSKTGENVAEVFHTLLKEVEKDDGLLAEHKGEGCTIL